MSISTFTASTNGKCILVTDQPSRSLTHPPTRTALVEAIPKSRLTFIYAIVSIATQ